MGTPKWLGKEKSTRERSYKQEKSLAKKFGGRTTSNSGATFGENDVKSNDFHIEAKTTKSSQYILKLTELAKMERRTPFDKISLFVINFECADKEYVLLSLSDFLELAGLDGLK